MTRVAFTVLIGFASLSSGLHAETAIDFNRDVRPIISRNCLACHGPDENERKAELRLDDRDSAVTVRDGLQVIKPGEPKASLLIQRIRSTDPDEVMPPPEAHKTITKEEVRLLESWIKQGAPYADHWAFIPPTKAKLNKANNATWATTPIDPFVLDQLGRKDLEPLKEASRRQLLRRVTFDLTGLPPTIDDLRQFDKESHPNAYDRELDRLLASPRYGERMTLAWMDAARYGDTSVMHADGNRDMWPWRDWVLNAYNHNKPFDEFTIEQLAGDLIPDASVEQQVASGFNRNHATSDEGGAIPEELRVEYVVDRVKTTANVWMALTMECSQCHDHKYDPISQKEYYQFFAYFNNTTDPGMQTRNGNQKPFARVLNDDMKRRLGTLRQQTAELDLKRNTAKPQAAEIETWIRTARDSATADKPMLSVWKQLGPFPAKDAKRAFKKDFGPEAQSSAIDYSKSHDKKTWQAGDAWADGAVQVLKLGDKEVLYLARDIVSPMTMKAEISLGSDDSVKAWLNGKSIASREAQRSAAADQEKADVTLKPGKNQLLLKIINHSGQAGFYFKLKAEGFPKEIVKLLKNEPQSSKLVAFYQRHLWPEGLDMDRRLADLRNQQKTLVDSAPTSMIMEDNREEPRMTYILNRGQYDQPKKDQPVNPGLPASLPPLPNGASADRLGLATWLTLPDHPLTARVAVNRYWAMLFGEGIVSTIGDFGSQGAWPSHPALIDWLAVDFVESGWNVKRMMRQMVSSAAYRQSSRVTPTSRQRDPENRLIAHGPRFRLQGELIRDQALAISGLLVERVGGRGVKPYQPPNIWNEVSLNGGLHYQPDTKEKLYRRSMYTFWKRSAPMPNMMIFDAPSREKCTLQRPRTNTPLQALVTLNDPQFVESARAMAQRLLGLDDLETDAQRINYAYELGTGRPAKDREIALVRDILNKKRTSFQAAPKEAEALLGVGESKRDSSLNPAEHAAWTIVAQLILNLDEFLTRG